MKEIGFKEKIKNSEKSKREKLLDECIVPVFALVREVTHRQIGLLLFPTQIFGGLVLHEGNIAQMNTGEGKTLTAFLPISKPVLDFFGITSGVNLQKLSAAQKKDLYHDCTVIYTTSSELGFDYLRNNLVTNPDEKRQQDYNYAIIDEVDSILIDEAQNPLIISRPAARKNKIHPLEYELATKIAISLEKKKDYIVDQKERIDYVSYQDKITLIDLLTGRLALNRVYGSGIHQAIESKENLPVTPPSKNIATITYQNFFRLFTKLAGMTGTAASEAKEFREVYGMEVIVIPPYRKLIRKDHDALFFFDRDKEIFHHVLNATNHELEAQIISRAGEIGSVVVSTNMVGRGVDIPLSKESKKAGGLMVIIVEPNSILQDELVKNLDIKAGITRFLGWSSLKEAFRRPLSGKTLNFIVSEPQESLCNIQADHRQRTLNRDLLINRQRKIIYDYREKILTSPSLGKFASLQPESNFPLRSFLLQKIDDFWSEYLECLNKIDELTKQNQVVCVFCFVEEKKVLIPVVFPIATPKTANSTFIPPGPMNLPYKLNDLEPIISSRTMYYHYEILHKNYEIKLLEAIKGRGLEEKFFSLPELMANLNKLSGELKEDVRFFGGGLINHNFFFTHLTGFNLRLKETETEEKITPGLLNLIQRHFAILNGKNEELEIINTANQDGPWSLNLLPLIAIDVWEHAYFLDYGANRQEYVEKLLNHLLN
ncbi:390_t:CDS:2 [Gigaspora margarita]|uniref:superoxide dismutase n=1 Tax=Gigaspora margarita TaxID=4874 RepID=A0ABM8VWY9_GIGMA|nr:390_t:CDS:2 [Gigaspora margarita]